jgi:hypothetical protein
VHSAVGPVPPLSHLTSCTPTKSNLYYDSSFDSVTSEPALYKLLMFQVPNLISIFRRLGPLSKESAQVRGSVRIFVVRLFFYGERMLASCPTPKPEDHPLPAVRGCLFNVFAAALHSCRQLPPLQPEDASCCGDKGPTYHGRFFKNWISFLRELLVTPLALLCTSSLD